MSNQENQSPIFPSSVQVRYRAQVCTGDPSVRSSFPLYYISSVNLSDISITIPSPDYAGFPGRKIFNDTALATYYASGGDPSNRAVLDALASAVASDFYNWRSFGSDVVFNGVIAPKPNGVLTDIEWTYRDDDSNTRLLSEGNLDDYEELAHVHGPSASACIDVASSFTTASKVPSWEVYGPPATPTSLGAGHIQLSRFQVSLEDGRLRTQFTQSDIINCGCVGSSSLCTGQICVKLFDSCTNRGIPNATSYVSHAGGGASGFCVTATGTVAGGTAFGYCCVPVSDTGTAFNYNVNIVGPTPYSPILVTGVHVNCNDVTTITRSAGGGTICVRISDGCLFTVPGLNTTVTLSGATTPGVYGPDGLYCFGPGLAHGTYTLTVTTPGDCYVSPATFSIPFGGGCLNQLIGIALKDPPCCCATCNGSAMVLDNPAGITFTSSHLGTVFLPSHPTERCLFGPATVNYNYPGKVFPFCAAGTIPVTINAQLGNSLLTDISFSYTYPCSPGAGPGSPACPLPVGGANAIEGPNIATCFPNHCSLSPFMASATCLTSDSFGNPSPLFLGAPDAVTMTI